MKNIISGFLAFAVSASAFGAVKEKIHEYKLADTTLEGIVTVDSKGPKKKPAVIIIHNWNSIDDYEKMRAKEIAKLGYVAFVADIYGKGVRPTTVEESSKLSSSYKKDIPLLRARLLAAYEEVLKMPNVDTKNIAIMGYCFGGTAALELGRSGADLKGIVSFHGGLATPDAKDAKNIKGKVLALHGADDPYVSEKEVMAFQKEMRDAKVNWELVSYGNAVHAFTEKEAGSDNSKGAAYNETADKRSWEAMKNFFKEVFAK